MCWYFKTRLSSFTKIFIFFKFGRQLLKFHLERMKNLLVSWPTHAKLRLKTSRFLTSRSVVSIRRPTDISVYRLRVLCGSGNFVGNHTPTHILEIHDKALFRLAIIVYVGCKIHNCELLNSYLIKHKHGLRDLHRLIVFLSGRNCSDWYHPPEGESQENHNDPGK